MEGQTSEPWHEENFQRSLAISFVVQSPCLMENPAILLMVFPTGNGSKLAIVHKFGGRTSIYRQFCCRCHEIPFAMALAVSCHHVTDSVDSSWVENWSNHHGWRENIVFAVAVAHWHFCVFAFLFKTALLLCLILISILRRLGLWKGQMASKLQISSSTQVLRDTLWLFNIAMENSP